MIKHVRKDGNLHMNTENIKKPDFIHNEEYDINIRPYLTTNDIIEIAETAMTMENPMEQEISIAVNTLRACTDIDKDELFTMEVDDIMWSGLWQTVVVEIVNFDMVLSYISYYENAGIAISKFLNKTLPKFLESIDKDLNKYIKKLPKGSEWDEFMKNTPKMLEDVLNQVKADGNADIIAGAAKMGE